MKAVRNAEIGRVWGRREGDVIENLGRNREPGLETRVEGLKRGKAVLRGGSEQGRATVYDESRGRGL